ncbi:MAG: ANTAR domain-containing protein [Sulfuriferula sp.]|jgi:response regulator NasT|nr:ANTAR domain-containing protein [Sulfuriferula sp.]
MLTVMIVDDDAQRAQKLQQAFHSQGYKVAELVASAFALPSAIAKCAPDVIIIGADSPNRDMLEHLCVATRDCPRPVVMFTDDHASESIRAALKAGVSAYIVDGLDSARLQPILEVARVRFEEHQVLVDAANKANRSQEERDLIAAAKQRLMADQNMSESDAYHAMRRTAMAENRRLVEIAEAIMRAIPPIA